MHASIMHACSSIRFYAAHFMQQCGLACFTRSIIDPPIDSVAGLKSSARNKRRVTTHPIRRDGTLFWFDDLMSCLPSSTIAEVLDRTCGLVLELWSLLVQHSRKCFSSVVLMGKG